MQALSDIGSVIKNPEMADISSKLISALRDPEKNLLSAVNLLLEQSFAHAIDTPSLSLIIPLIDFALRAHDNQIKKKACLLVGNICQVVLHSNDLLPYLPIVIPALKSALFDPIPQVRAAAAKALGALCKGLGMTNSQNILKWLKELLQTDCTHTERSGAARGYAEIIAAFGEQFFNTQLPHIIEFTTNKAPYVRDGYTTLFVFLPMTFTDYFEKYFNFVLPVILEGLSDSSDQVRGTAKRVVQMCIRQYGKTKTDVLLSPLLDMIYAVKWRIRESALTLLGELLKLLEQDIVKSTPRYFSIEEKQDVLSALFILRYDGIEHISLLASQVLL